MSDWYWVRHGPTHASAMIGWTDLPADLSDTAALTRLQGHLPEDALVVSSDLVRAVDTAAAIRGPRDLLERRPGLREMHFGAWEGLGFAEAEARDPDLARRFWSDPGDIAPPGGESWNALAARVRAEIAEIRELAGGRPVVAVAHFGVILAALQHASGAAPRAILSFRIDPLSVTQIAPAGDDWAVQRVNHVP